MLSARSRLAIIAVAAALSWALIIEIARIVIYS